MLCWTLVALSIRATFAAQVVGNLTLLSYNVAGLPAILSSGHPADDTVLISPRLQPYNVVHVQEDFNYHAILYAGDHHAFRTPTSGGAAIGSGDNALSDFPFMDFYRNKWDKCNLNGGDCLTPKGFTFMRVRVSDGFWIDMYNLHTDAGSDAGDISARLSNLNQVADYMAKWSQGMPVIVMGDTNSRYTRDGVSLNNFISRTGLTDQWVSVIRGGNAPALGALALVCPFPFPAGTLQADQVACEVVDKIFVRGNPTVSFPATTFANAHNSFVNGTGAPLSDHYPITSTLTWKLSPSLRLDDPVGGPHGDPFNDVANLLSSSVPQLTTITIRGGERVDGVTYTAKYADGTTATATHGGNGGNANTLTLNADERVVSAFACSDKYSGTTRVFYLKLTTNTGRTLAAGKTTGDCTTTNVPTDGGSPGAWGLVGFWGRDGDEVDRIAPIWGASY